METTAQLWLKQLTDRTVTDWISYGSMSHQKHGRLKLVERCKQGLRILLTTGQRVVWRASKALAERVLQSMPTRYTALVVVAYSYTADNGRRYFDSHVFNVQGLTFDQIELNVLNTLQIDLPWIIDHSEFYVYPIGTNKTEAAKRSEAKLQRKMTNCPVCRMQTEEIAHLNNFQF